MEANLENRVLQNVFFILFLLYLHTYMYIFQNIQVHSLQRLSGDFSQTWRFENHPNIIIKKCMN